MSEPKCVCNPHKRRGEPKRRSRNHALRSKTHTPRTKRPRHKRIVQPPSPFLSTPSPQHPKNPQTNNHLPQLGRNLHPRPHHPRLHPLPHGPNMVRRRQCLPENPQVPNRPLFAPRSRQKEHHVLRSRHRKRRNAVPATGARRL